MDETTGMTDEEIAAANVGELKEHNAPIALSPYDDEWPLLFAREEERIRAALGGQVVALEHTGSTSVPGLSAKPIIDMTLVVLDSSDESAYVPQLEAAGYRLTIREPDWFEHRLLKGPDTNVNLHVFSQGCEEVERMTRFRDHLRTNENDRGLYERTKRQLAEREWKYVQNYADAKTNVIREIMERVG
jgi:GrpB-like predicted nucleotidyltransferase (UPF0157 family)